LAKDTEADIGLGAATGTGVAVAEEDPAAIVDDRASLGIST
jgi:hypothetical protein